jgi:linoleoyl-CoA desaturase
VVANSPLLTAGSALQPDPAATQGSPDGSQRALKFATDVGFRAELRRRVGEYFQRTGQRERDVPRMYLKTAVILAWYVASYVLLVFVAQTWWLAVPLAASLALAMAAVAFSIQHDGSHNAYSDRPWVNKLAATTLDMLGASSYLWRYQHVIAHHTAANVAGHDIDIDLEPIARVSPQQPRHWFHRWQHLYMWPMYGLAALRWHLFADFRGVLQGRMGHLRFARPRSRDLALFLGGKVVSLGLLLGIPIIFHTWWVVLIFYGIVVGLLGVLLGVTFQLAHCVEEADFPVPEGVANRMGHSRAIHQVETTVDFAPRSRLAAWFFGGLNFQVEHHLFPQVCHVHYRAIAPLVEQTCAEFGVRYAVHRSVWAGLVSHYRWLRRMGRSDPEPAAAPS